MLSAVRRGDQIVTGGGMTSTAGGKMLFNAPTFYVNSPSIGFSSKPSSGGGMGAAGLFEVY